MTSRERPTWLLILFGVQALGWLAQSGCSCFFTFFASAYPETPRLAYLVSQVLVALAVGVVFVAGATRPIQNTVLQRAAHVHALAGVLATIPFVLLAFASAYQQLQQDDMGSSIGSVLLSLASFGIVIGAVFASRNEKRGWQIFGLVVGVLWLVAAGLFMLGAGAGIAGISA